jgi:hypothetical protein
MRKRPGSFYDEWDIYVFICDTAEMNNLNRGSSIYASYQVSVHLVKQFQRRRFFKINQSETRIVCGGHVCKWIGMKCTIFIKDLP